jgi:hypothetical protein
MLQVTSGSLVFSGSFTSYCMPLFGCLFVWTLVKFGRVSSFIYLSTMTMNVTIFAW